MTLTYPIRSDKLTMTVSVREHLASVRSDFQQIDVYDTEAFGRVLTLDGHVQLATLDEAAYHESLVHVCGLNVPEVKRALVVGGGDGGVVRELCRYPSLARADMVEIDRAVVDVSRQHLPTVSGGAFDDPRVNLVIDDAFEFVSQASEPYDLIVVDCTDVYEEEEGELSERLFTDEFYRSLNRLLNKDGFVATQADNPVFCSYSVDDVRSMFGRVFALSGSYWGIVPSFGGFSAYVWGSGNSHLRPDPIRASFADKLSYLSEATYKLGLSPLPWQ